jgi:acyl carrier protein
VEAHIIAERIKKFLVQQFPATKNVGNEEPLLKNGLIDSLGILDVVTFLEKEFGIAVTDEELLPENFESVHSLSNFVQQKNNGITRL